MEGGSSFNALNFNVDYNEATGMNFTGAGTGVAVYVCPAAVHQPDGLRDGGDPYDPITSVFGTGYGYGDYGATNYVDIDPFGQAPYAAKYPATPTGISIQGPMGCSTRARPQYPRSPTAPAIPWPSAKTPGVILGTTVRTRKAITMASTLAQFSDWDRRAAPRFIAVLALGRARRSLRRFRPAQQQVSTRPRS